MPLWQRKFVYNSIKEHYEAEKAAKEKAAGNQKLDNKKPTVAKPAIPNPSYTTKASKK